MSTQPDNIPTGWRWWLWPLRSRKVQVALATIVAAWAAHAGLEISESVLTAIIGVGIAVILGIAVEDAGAKAGAGQQAGATANLLTSLIAKSKAAAAGGQHTSPNGQ